MRSIISRQGGKSRLYKRLISLFPRHTHYAEIFGGAGWCLLNKEKSTIEIFNDVDSNLMNLFRVIRDFPGEFVNRYRYEVVSRKTFDEYKKLDFEKLSLIDKAVKWYYVYYNSFCGDMNSFILRKKKSNPNRFISRLPKLVEEIALRFEDIIVEDLDFREFFDKYGEKEFFYYLDPPYFGMCGYEFPFSEKDHQDLHKCLKNFKGKFLMTYNKHIEVLKMYKGFCIQDIESDYQAANRPHAYTDKSNEGKQIVIKNY